MVVIQAGKCKACGDVVDITQGNKLQIDHDHSCCAGVKSCGKCIRGLLCPRCNKILGFSKDSILLLEKLIDYLKLTKF